MPSLVDICNMALLRCGTDPIALVSDDNNRAKACRTAWPFVRRHVLRSHSWNSATVRRTLPVLTETPDWEFESYYQVPSDCLHLIEVDTDDDWRVENGKIAAEGNGTLSVRYIKDETDTEKYDASLAMVMALRLAVEICEKITGSRPKRELLLQEYMQVLNDAKVDDGQEQSPAEFEEDDWIRSRVI